VPPPRVVTGGSPRGSTGVTDGTSQGDSGCCHGRLVTCGCVTIRSLPRGKDTKEAPSHGASFSFWKGGEHRAGVVLFGIMLLGAIAGLVITLLIALMIPQAHSPG